VLGYIGAGVFKIGSNDKSSQLENHCPKSGVYPKNGEYFLLNTYELDIYCFTIFH